MELLIEVEPDESTLEYLPDYLKHDSNNTATEGTVVKVRFLGVKDFQFTADGELMLFTPVGEVFVAGDLLAAGEESILDLQTYREMIDQDDSELTIAFPSHHHPGLKTTLTSLSKNDAEYSALHVIEEYQNDQLKRLSFITNDWNR